MTIALFMVGEAWGLHGAVRASEPVLRRGVQSATIHWEDVPLRDAISRLGKVFDETVFLDRRVDPNKRVAVGLVAHSARDVLADLAEQHGWGVSQLGPIVYLGPPAAAQNLRRVAVARGGDVAHLTGSLRTPWEQKSSYSWPRLAEPRALATALIDRNGWRVADADRIPHDLWSAGELPELALHQQLTMLLFGFDLTYKIRASDRTIQIVPLEVPANVAQASAAPSRRTTTRVPRAPAGTKQVYSLRVAEKPVGAVMRELGKRLNWQVEFDEAAIRAAGLSLDARVSFVVENVEQDALLDAVLRPAGLTFRRDGERIKIIPRP